MITDVCPNCGSRRVHRSRKRCPAEHLLVLFGAGLFRCHECDKRYAGLGHSMVHLADLRAVSRRVTLAFGMVVAVVLVTVSILWFSRSQVTPSPDRGESVPAGAAVAAGLQEG